jgi:ribosome recycling factor
MEKEKEIGQDEEHRGMDEHQKLHDHYIGEINQALEIKEKDLLTI